MEALESIERTVTGRKYRKNSNWNCFDLVLEWFPSSIKY